MHRTNAVTEPTHWDLADFRAWADRALDVVRELEPFQIDVNR
jgi:hypothetical protein